MFQYAIFGVGTVWIDFLVDRRDRHLKEERFIPRSAVRLGSDFKTNFGVLAKVAVQFEVMGDTDAIVNEPYMRLVIEDIGIGPCGFRERSGVRFSLDTGTTMGPTAGRRILLGTTLKG